METQIKLNLGCGNDIKNGYINLDLIKSKGIDVVHNLNIYPYPFKENSFDEIYSSHIIEHLDNPSKFIEELWRISKNKGKIIIKTPTFQMVLCLLEI
jgi:predicted SAM-dependent methyltransferase